MNKIIVAARLAEECHRGQLREFTGTPYIHHPARVFVRVVAIPGTTEDMGCASWLHDAPEDCVLTPEQWQRWPPGDSYKLVEELTNEFTKEKYPQFNRQKRKNLEFARIANISYEAKLIKACDRIDNLSEIAMADDGFQRIYLQESLLLGEAILARHSSDPTLSSLVNELNQLALGAKAA